MQPNPGDSSVPPSHALGPRLLRASKHLLQALLDRNARATLAQQLETHAMHTLLELTRVTNDGGFRAQRQKQHTQTSDPTRPAEPTQTSEPAANEEHTPPNP